VLDERTAAFFATGVSRATHVPSALICTSGTAAANYLPAIVEAWHARVPLLVFTADRPPELRGRGAGQTIDQVHLYGTHTVWECAVSLCAASPAAIDNWGKVIATAWAHAIGAGGGIAGPVHVNVALGEPLAPATKELGVNPAELARLWEEWLAREIPLSPVPAAAVSFSPEDVFAWAARFRRGVIIAGETRPACPDSHVAAVVKLSRALGWPVLADALSPVRYRCADSGVVVVGAYETLLRDSACAQALRPDAVLQLGQLSFSRTLREWLASPPRPTLVFSKGGRNLNPLHHEHRTIPFALEDFAWDAAPPTQDAVVLAWANAWRAAHAAAAARIAGALDALVRAPAAPPLFEGAVAWLLARYLPDTAAVFLANSMPLRDAEYFWPTQCSRRRIFCNRGANGIDGTLGSALGVAASCGAPTFLLTGDLSLLHDSNAFLLARADTFVGSLTIVLINNNGGGIFNHLDVSRDNPYFDRFWGMSPQVDFAKLAAAHGVPHERVRSWTQLAHALSQPPAPGVRIIEIPTDRMADAQCRNALLAGIR
jgi:2-succinyl-5-enolpyruvyl-6-hydroxy-3-cyclohexene-1-carboxylate synthase